MAEKAAVQAVAVKQCDLRQQVAAFYGQVFCQGTPAGKIKILIIGQRSNYPGRSEKGYHFRIVNASLLNWRNPMRTGRRS
jgi:hypothetical protein